MTPSRPARHCSVLAGLLFLTWPGACVDTAPRTIVDSTAARAPADTSPPPAARSASDSAPVPAAPRPPVATAASAAVRRVGPRSIVFGGVNFTGIGHDRGEPSAPVVLIDLSDFACPYCGQFSRDVYPSIDREYVQTGKVLFKYIPFLAGFPRGAEATRAAECAADQGQFWPMLDRIYATQSEWKRGTAIDAQMAALAGTTGIDTVAYTTCYSTRRTEARTERATAVANGIGVRVTPSFLVDGHPVQGALPLAEFRRLIETALLVQESRRSAGGSGRR